MITLNTKQKSLAQMPTKAKRTHTHKTMRSDEIIIIFRIDIN